MFTEYLIIFKVSPNFQIKVYLKRELEKVTEKSVTTCIYHIYDILKDLFTCVLTTFFYLNNY